MQTYRLTPPTQEPVRVDDAKVAARLDGSHWDAVLLSHIATAREAAEHITGMRFCEQTWRAELTDWPATNELLPFFRPTAVAVAYWNGSAFVTLATNLYEWAPQDAGVVLAPALGTSWPTLGQVAIGPRVRIDITLGEADPDDVPPSAQQFIKAMVAVMVNDPTLSAEGVMEQSPYLPRLLDPLRMYR
jgi:uncharacterized phiE125 gp8 family phage protein